MNLTKVSKCLKFLVDVDRYTVQFVTTVDHSFYYGREKETEINLYSLGKEMDLIERQNVHTHS